MDKQIGIALGVALAAVAYAKTANADQCAVVGKATAVKAVKQINASKKKTTWCQPCGETAPSTPTNTGTASLKGSGKEWEVHVDGVAVDIAYLYVASGGNSYTNVGLSSGCKPDGVFTSFTHDGTGALGLAVIQRYSLRVDASDDEWFNTGVVASTGDLVVVRATGTTQISDKWPRLNPDGCPEKGSHIKCDGLYGHPKKGGSGSLVVRFGRSTPSHVGQRFSGYVVDAGGQIKFRIKDKKYSNNSGNLDVDLVVVPAALFPASSPLTAK